MPRRSTQGSGNPQTGAVGLMEPGSASSPVEVRPGASVSPEMVNVFEQAVSAGAAPGLRLVRLGDRPSGEAIALSILAWVRNVAYDKDVWIDLYVLGQGGVLHAETIPLDYQEPAEGGGAGPEGRTRGAIPRDAAVPRLLPDERPDLHGRGPPQPSDRGDPGRAGKQACAGQHDHGQAGGRASRREARCPDGRAQGGGTQGCGTPGRRSRGNHPQGNQGSQACCCGQACGGTQGTEAQGPEVLAPAVQLSRGPASYPWLTRTTHRTSAEECPADLQVRP